MEMSGRILKENGAENMFESDEKTSVAERDLCRVKVSAMNAISDEEPFHFSFFAAFHSNELEILFISLSSMFSVLLSVKLLTWKCRRNA